MGRFVIRRLLQMVPVLLGTTFLIFILVWALPGDPFAGKCGDRPCPPSYVAAQTEKLHLDQPLLVQYGYYMGNLVRGDLGETSSGEEVSSLVAHALPITLKLTVVAVIFEAIVGVGSGIVAALRRGGVFDVTSLALTLVLIAIPVFVLGFFLQYTLAIGLGWFRPTVQAGAPWRDLILPGFVLGSASMAYLSRLTRSSLTENLRSDYVRTATAKGLSRRRVIGKHAMRNSLIPVVTYLGADVGTLMAGAIITEGIFNIQGIGGLTYQSIVRRENGTVVAVVVVIVLIFLLANLIVDLLYAYLDPRIRYE